MQGIVEVWVMQTSNSPSVQCRVNALVNPVSTHDQVLGGATGQIFWDVPSAIDDYRLEIQERAHWSRKSWPIVA